MWNSVAELHAALNDLPVALFVASLVFDITGRITGRQSLKDAGYWALIGSAAGAILAVASGLSAERVIEHGSSMHRFVERHQTLAIAFTVLTVALTYWRVAARNVLPGRQGNAYLTLAGLGFLCVLWASKVGGSLVFQHGGGITTQVLEAAIADRAAGHEHAPGTPEHEHDGVASADSTAAETRAEEAGAPADHEH